MSADTLTRAAGELDIGKVIGGGFAVIRKRWPTYVVCALALCLLNLVSSILATGPYWNASAPNNAAVGRSLLWSMTLLFVIKPPILGLMAWTAWADKIGQPADLGAAAVSVGRQLGRLLLTNFILTVILFVGMILLVVPGVWLSMAFSVAIPACIVEGLGPEDALRRSFALTLGQRWRVFGYSILVGVIFILGWIFIWLIASILRASLAFILVPGLAGLSSLEQGLLGAFIPALTGSLYVGLLQLKGGAGAETTAEVFA